MPEFPQAAVFPACEFLLIFQLCLLQGGWPKSVHFMLFFIGTKGQKDGLRLLQQSCVHKHGILDPVVLVVSKSKSLDVLEEMLCVWAMFKLFPS